MRSFVEILSPATGKVVPVLQTDRLIEAPNWTPDGAVLIVNGGGQLFRVPLAAPVLDPVRCDGLNHLNNDHGVSPDGQSLVVSNSKGRGTAVIYSLPITGGVPRQVTQIAPSWWHGWSPEGVRLAYTCVRDGAFGIATCPLQGGEEQVLISGPHHYDGPDYAPDGQWIWFNSDRGGSMDLWRMRVDGSDVQQMTEDAEVNWFPHPSPDGRHVLYLAYPPGTEGHPRDRDVKLKLLDLKTREIRVLRDIFGGQGTINVPCWAPDGERFAYVRYATAPEG
ncbi:TolB family protein [Antarctobacter jejuensis]|uniref:TolB family protein n=1 Tax=Antarctobacter jejuensis TaxID=1439938 RepID=UPI003FD35DD8